MFIKIHERKEDRDVILNIDQIAIIWEDSGTICMAGTHGDGHGLIHTTKNEMDRLTRILDMYENRMAQAVE